MLLMQGPTRGGRGTIGRVLTALIGEASVAGLTLDDLSKDFGMEHLIKIVSAHRRRTI
jgi:putative DNA primase/helicase